jgi:hypothetical protein
MRRRSLTPVPVTADTTRRRTVRHVAAALSALVASVYLLIGFDVIRVVDAQATTAGELLPFGLVAGGAFALGAVLLVALDARPLWLVGAAFQVIVLVLYVVVAPERTPPFEIWGVLLRVRPGRGAVSGTLRNRYARAASIATCGTRSSTPQISKGGVRSGATTT